MYLLFKGASLKIAKKLLRLSATQEFLSTFAARSVPGLSPSLVGRELMGLSVCNLAQTMSENGFEREFDPEDRQDILEDFVMEILRVEKALAARDGADRMEKCMEVLGVAERLKPHFNRTKIAQGLRPRKETVKDVLKNLGVGAREDLQKEMSAWLEGQHRRFLAYLKDLLDPIEHAPPHEEKAPPADPALSPGSPQGPEEGSLPPMKREVGTFEPAESSSFEKLLYEGFRPKRDRPPVTETPIPPDIGKVTEGPRAVQEDGSLSRLAEPVDLEILAPSEGTEDLVETGSPIMGGGEEAPIEGSEQGVVEGIPSQDEPFLTPGEMTALPEGVVPRMAVEGAEGTPDDQGVLLQEGAWVPPEAGVDPGEGSVVQTLEESLFQEAPVIEDASEEVPSISVDPGVMNDPTPDQPIPLEVIRESRQRLGRKADPERLAKILEYLLSVEGSGYVPGAPVLEIPPHSPVEAVQEQEGPPGEDPSERIEGEAPPEPS